MTAIAIEDLVLRYPRRPPRKGLKDFFRSLRRLRSTGEHSFTALKGLSVDIAEGEVVGIIGRNGAGKSTLLRVISGVYRPDGGRVRVAGAVTLLAGLGAGFNVHLTGRENVYLYGSVLGHSRKKLDKLFDSIIEFAGLEEFVDEPIRAYSSGMRARLGFAIATAIRPDILLVDEVFAVGDAEFKAKSRQRILEIVEEAGTVVIVSHSFDLLDQVCSRLLLIESGELIMDGDPASVIEEYHERDARRKRHHRAQLADADTEAPAKAAGG